MNVRNISTFFALLIFTQLGRADGLDTWIRRNPVPPQEPGTGHDLLGITYGNGQFVTVGRGYYDPGSGKKMNSAILSSVDGVNWVQRQSGTTTDLHGIAYGNGQFVAVGDGYDPVGQHALNSILTSADGVTWVQRQSEGQNLHAIAYGNGRFVAVGGDTITSTDGVNWVEHQIQLPVPGGGIAFGNGQFVAVGDTILSSTDGVNWVQRQSGAQSGSFSGIAYGSGQFVAVGYGWTRPTDPLLDRTYFEITATSTDGVTWVYHQWPTENGPYGIAYGNGQFVAVGNAHAVDAPSFPPGTVQTSTDGIDWVQRSGEYGISLMGVAFGQGSFVAVGTGGAIFQSGSVIALTLTPSAQPGSWALAVPGSTGLNCIVQSSTDLVSWRNLTNFTGFQPKSLILEVPVARSDRLFYRAYSQ